MIRLLLIKSRFWILPFGIICLLAFMPPTEVDGAPGDIVNCSSPLNLSNSEGYASIDPFVLADPAGVVHLFWAERINGQPGSGSTDAIMYAVWDGETWSEPIDIFLSPLDHFNRKIGGIRGVIDDQGVIHLMWLGPDNTFYYSSVHANEAGSASFWQQPLQLADDQTGTQYSFDLAYESPHTLHVVYGRSRQGDVRSVSYIWSEDGGLTWSEPAEINHITDIERGASNIRLLVDQPGKVYATWTEWDLSGNGQAIYFSRSLDSGKTWDYPVLLDERVDNDYERDWTNLAVLGEDQLVVMWEGGFRAYPQAQYSSDGGVTWSKPIDTFYWLIADNGFANLIRDNAGNLHAFLVRRIREGFDDVCRFPGCTSASTTNTLWHSVWEGGKDWQEPRPVSDFVFDLGDGSIGELGGNFTSVAINEGNQLVTAWFDYTYFELVVMQCEIEGAAAETPQPWPTATLSATLTPELPTISTESPTAVTPIPTRANIGDLATPPESTSNPAASMLVGIIPVLILVGGVTLFHQIRNRSH